MDAHALSEGRRPWEFGPFINASKCYEDQGSLKGIWENPDVKSVIAKRVGRIISIRSIISFLLGIFRPC